VARRSEHSGREEEEEEEKKRKEESVVSVLIRNSLTGTNSVYVSGKPPPLMEASGWGWGGITPDL